jgi:glycosyltransferase involved in cell wall biosynthesis
VKEAEHQLNKYKICVYGVCKNEEQFVDRFMDCLGDADMVVIGDTGSTDNTAEKFRARGAVVYDIPVIPWRFDKARNELLKFIPEDVDICFSLDVDEVLNAGWRKCIEDCWTKDTTRGRYLYTWSYNADGTPGVQFSQHRMHARQGYHWIYPTHEVLEYIGDKQDSCIYIEGLKVDHYPDNTKNRGFNLSLLELALKEFPDDVRNTHYLGREYMFARRWDDSIATLKKYLSLPNATWAEERSASMRFIGLCYSAKGNYAEAKSWTLRAIAETPAIRDPYIALAFLSYGKRDWVPVYFAVTEALKIKDKNIYGYPNDPRAWNSDIYDLGAIACYHIGLLQQSVEYAQTALSLSPDDERLKGNLALMKAREEESK